MLDMRTGKVAYAILSLCIFTTDEKLVAMPWSALTLDTVSKRFVVNIEKDRLINAPWFEKKCVAGYDQYRMGL